MLTYQEVTCYAAVHSTLSEAPCTPGWNCADLIFQHANLPAVHACPGMPRLRIRYLMMNPQAGTDLTLACRAAPEMVSMRGRNSLRCA